MATTSIFDQAKTALRLMTTAPEIENEIDSLIMAGIADLQESAGVDVGNITTSRAAVNLKDPHDVLVATAVKTYVKMHFGEPEEYGRLKLAYDEMKAQLHTITYGRKAGRHGQDG